MPALTAGTMARIVYKSARDLEKMREAGLVVSRVLAALRREAAPGVSTAALDATARRIIADSGGHPSFLGYRGFPASICSSIDAEIVHGIPRETRVLRDGEILKLDVGVRLKGFHADSAVTIPVGSVPDELERLLAVTREALWRGIHAITLRGRLQEISRAVQEHVEAHGFSVARDLVGHGVGRRLHEEPQIPNFVSGAHPNPLLLEGMTLAIEPMVNAGRPEIRVLEDGWTIVTADGRASAHFEHTVAVTRRGAEVLTLGPHDPGP